MSTKTTASMTMQERIALMKANAAAKFQTSAAAVALTGEQKIKDAARVAAASLNIAGAVARLQSVELPENCDVDKTSKKLLQNAKNALAKLVKTTVETYNANGGGDDVDTTEIDTFGFENSDVKIEFVCFETAPDYKGAIVAVDYANISDDAKQKLHGIGLSEEMPFGILTSVTLDKSVNVIFIKIGGDDLSKGTVRLSQKYVALLDDVNEAKTVESFNAKIAELTSQMKAPDLKISPKSFEYVAEKIAGGKSTDKIKKAVLATYPTYSELTTDELQTKINDICDVVSAFIGNILVVNDAE